MFFNFQDEIINRQSTDEELSDDEEEVKQSRLFVTSKDQYKEIVEDLSQVIANCFITNEVSGWLNFLDNRNRLSIRQAIDLPNTQFVLSTIFLF